MGVFFMSNSLDFKSGIIKALEQSFIFIDDSELDEVDLSSYIEDSIQFMSFIVHLEEIFELEIPAELMRLDNFKNPDEICSIISELKKQDII